MTNLINIESESDLNNNAHIWLAGGCFWGVEQYFSLIKGFLFFFKMFWINLYNRVISTSVGFANSVVKNPSYKEVCGHTTHASETCHVMYDPNIINLRFLLDMYLKVIDPTSLNKQGLLI
jgi:peptide methionine sulfoxide reductase msrA/msrB